MKELKKWFHTSFLLVLTLLLLLPNNIQANERVTDEVQIDVGTSEKTYKIQSYKKRQKAMKEQISTDTLIVKYDKKLAKSVHKRAGTTLVKSIPSLKYDVVKLNKGQKLQTAIRYYSNVKHVANVQPSMKYQLFGKTGDPKKDNMYHLSLLNIDEALKLAGDHPVTVAVVDTGIDKNHPELKSQILPPYNAVNPAAGQTLDLHGTHVAGIVGAEMNNGIGGHGVNPHAKILPIDVFDGYWGASDYVLAEAMIYAINKDVDVINMSLGGYFESSIFKEAVQQAIDAGITVVAAAGNEATDEYSIPASYADVISVGSIDRNKKLAYDSNYGPSVNVVAPGVDVYSTIFNPLKGPSFMEGSGTSMASPVVAGVAALIKSKYPDLLPHEVKALLEHTATDLGEEGYDHTFGHGLINPVAALTYDTEKLPKRANKIHKDQMLKEAKEISGSGRLEETGTFTQPGEVDFYQMPIHAGEKIQTILSGSDLYDYQYELIFVSKKGEIHDPILINDAKAGKTEGYLYEADKAGTLIIKVQDANGNYNVNGKSEYTLQVEKLTELIYDDSSTDNLISVKLPYQSNKDDRGPFTLLSKDKTEPDYDYFTFSVDESQLTSIYLAGLPGVDTSLTVYDEDGFNEYAGIEDEDVDMADIDYEGENWLAVASKNGYGGAERLVFEAEPDVTYVLQVASEPNDGYDFFEMLFGDIKDGESRVGRSSYPYELMIEKAVLPPDEDGLPIEEPESEDEEDTPFDDEWFDDELLDCEEQGSEEDCDDIDHEERMFDKDEVDTILKHTVAFRVGAKKQGYFQFSGDEDYYQLTSEENAIYEVNVTEGENQFIYATVYEYDEETHDFIPVLELFNMFEETDSISGAVAFEKNKKYIFQMMNIEGISIDPYELQVNRINNVPAEKSADKSKPELAVDIKKDETHNDYFIYNFEQYYYFKNEDEAQVYTVHALPEKLTNEKRAALPTILNKDLLIGMAIIEDTNGNRVIDPEEETKLVEFYPDLTDPSRIVNGSFKAKKDVGYFIVLVNFTEGLTIEQYALTLNDITRKDEDEGSVVENNIPSKPLTLRGDEGKLVGKGYFNAGIPYGDKDYYVFNTTGEGAATFSLKAGPGLDGVIKVYNVQGVLVGSFDYYGVGDDEVGTINLAKGKYYVEVSEATDKPSFIPYELSVQQQ